MPPKRKSDVMAEPEISEEQAQAMVENMPVTDNCDAVRRKIRAFIDNGGMKVSELQRAINTNSVSYGRFMNQSGAWKGQGSQVYVGAWAFFKKREVMGLKMPRKKAKVEGESEVEVPGAGLGPRKTSAPDVDVSGITLEDEMEDEVPLYDTCDDIRRKISAHLQKPGVTQASFLRAIAAQFHTDGEKKIQSKMLNDFRNKSGPTAGNMSSVYYGAYVYFEKLRIKENKPKSKKRLEMEQHWAHTGGVDRKHRMQKVVVPVGASVWQDKLGRIQSDWY